eukprot:12902323-Prorocentrum_lima.AAC.1
MATLHDDIVSSDLTPRVEGGHLSDAGGIAHDMDGDAKTQLQQLQLLCVVSAVLTAGVIIGDAAKQQAEASLPLVE